MADKRKILICDILVFITMLLICFALIFVPEILNSTDGKYISVYKDNVEVKTLSLDNDTVYTVPDTDYTVEIKNKKAKVISAGCPDKLCQKMQVTSDGGSIICLPLKIVIRLSAETKNTPYDLIAG